jgi:branched-chain amino acid transport system substrate-binding protein
MRARKLIRLACSIAVVSLAAAACGDDDDDTASPTAASATTAGSATTASATTGDSGAASSTTSGGTTTTSGAATPSTLFEGEVPVDTPPTVPTGSTTDGVTDTEVHVRGLWSMAQFAGAEVGAQARFQRANDAGGVNGRQIVLDEMLDDGIDQSKNLDQGKKIVGEHDTFAVVPVMTGQLSSADYFEEQKIPFFGWGIQPLWTFNEYAFSPSGAGQEGPTSQQPTNVWAGLFPDKTANHTMAIITEDTDSAKDAARNWESIYAQGGLKTVFNKSTIPAAPAVVSDFSPFATQVIDSKAEMVIIAGAPTTSIGMAKALAAQNYPGIMANFSLYDPRVAAATPGLYTFIAFTPWETTGVPAMDQMKADVQAVKSDQLLTQAVAYGYFAADLFVSILEKTGRDLTRENFMKVANGNFTWELEGVSGPVSFPNYHQNFNPCAAFVKSNGTGFEVAVPYTCGTLTPNPVYKGPR